MERLSLQQYVKHSRNVIEKKKKRQRDKTKMNEVVNVGWIEIYVTEVPNDKLQKLENDIVETIENMLMDDVFDKTEVDSSKYVS